MYELLSDWVYHIHVARNALFLSGVPVREAHQAGLLPDPNLLRILKNGFSNLPSVTELVEVMGLDSECLAPGSVLGCPCHTNTNHS